jgi:ribosomal protein L7Ae-like RNA K-turn-binding protein
MVDKAKERTVSRDHVGDDVQVVATFTPKLMLSHQVPYRLAQTKADISKLVLQKSTRQTSVADGDKTSMIDRPDVPRLQ